MPRVRALLLLLLLVMFAVLTGCSSTPQSTTSLKTTGIDFFPTTARRLEAKQTALNRIFSDSLTRDATAAIKRTGVTIQWTYPLPSGVKEYTCTVIESVNCGTFVMIGKVDATTSYVVNMTIRRNLDASFSVRLTHAYVLQTHRMSSSRTVVSAADLNNKTAVWVDANVSVSGLRTASANSATVRLSASSPISGYGNLGKLLTVGGGNLAPTVCLASTLTVQCSGHGSGTPYVPPAPQPAPEPKCNKDACNSERYDARTANWKMAEAVLRTGGEVGGAVIACAAVARVAPGAAKDACKVAAVAGAASVAGGTAKVRDANVDKTKYQDCKKRHPCVSCLDRDGYLAGKKSSWQNILG